MRKNAVVDSSGVVRVPACCIAPASAPAAAILPVDGRFAPMLDFAAWTWIVRRIAVALFIACMSGLGGLPLQPLKVAMPRRDGSGS